MVWKIPRYLNSFRMLPRRRLKVRASAFGRAVGDRLARFVGKLARGIGWVAEGVFGLISLVLGLSILAALPVAQFLSLGYFLESSARVARSGRLRDGLIGVRPAARVGGMVMGTSLSLLPLWLAGSPGDSAELIDPGGPVARGCANRVTRCDLAHALAHCHGACSRRPAAPFLLAVRHAILAGSQGEAGGVLRQGTRRVLGLRGLVAAAALLPAWTDGIRGDAGMADLAGEPDRRQRPLSTPGFRGRLPAGPRGTVDSVPSGAYAVEGRLPACIPPRRARPAFAEPPGHSPSRLLILVVASVPLYLLKIEMIPREAAWLPSLVFVIFWPRLIFWWVGPMPGHGGVIALATGWSGPSAAWPSSLSPFSMSW